MYGKSYKIVMVKCSVTDAVSNAFSEISSLGEEMRETADNMSSANMEHLPKYEMANEAADTLENHQDEPDVPDDFGEVEIEYSEGHKRNARKSPSRAVRLGNAGAALNAVVEALEPYREAKEQRKAELEAKKGRSEEEQTELDGIEEQVDAAENFVNEIQEAIDEIESVEFPGMFG